MSPTMKVWTAVGAAVTAVWAVWWTDVLPLDTTPVGQAAAVGAAVVVTATWVPVPATVERLLASGVALVLLPPAMAARSLLPAAAAAAVLAVLRIAVAARAHRHQQLPVLAAVGAGLFGVAVLTAQADTGTWALPGTTDVSAALALAGAVAVLASAAVAGSAPWARILVVPALLVGVAAAAVLPASATAASLAIAAAGAAAAGAGASLPVGLLSLTAATVPDARPAALLLAAAAVLAAPLVEHGLLAALPAVPGAVAFAATDDLVAVALVPVVLALVLRPGPADHRPLVAPLVPLLLATAVLVLAPSTWTWVGDARVHHLDAGASTALAVGAVAVGARRVASLLHR